MKSLPAVWCVLLSVVGGLSLAAGLAWADGHAPGARGGASGGGLLPYDIAETGLTGRTIVVAPDGDADAAGTEDEPMTLRAAALIVEPGDTVLARGGVYTNVEGDDVTLVNIRRGGTAENWVKFANYPGETPVLRFDSLRGIRVETASHLVIEGFEIEGMAADTDPDEAMEHALNFKGDDFSQHHLFGAGIRIAGLEDPVPGLENTFPHHIILRNNRIHHCPGGGISVARADYVLIEGNEVFKNAFYSPWGGSGISVWQSHNHDDRQDVYRTVIKDNVCYQNDNRVPFWMLESFSDGNGIILDALHNTQDNLTQDGYDRAYNGRVLVANNRCFLNGGRGVNVFESDNVDIVHNTLVLNSQRDNMINEIELGRTKNTRIFNNIIVVADGQQAIGGYQSSEITIDHNLIHGADAKDFPYGDHVETGHPQFAAAPTGPPADDQTVSLADIDFSLATGSPAHGIASPKYAYPKDAEGNPRPESSRTAGALID